jgi:hypothetical protein
VGFASCRMAVKYGRGLGYGESWAPWANARLAQASSREAIKVSVAERLVILIGLLF